MSPSIKWNQHIFLCGAKGLVASTVSSEEEVVSCSGGSKEATKNCEQAATCTAAEDVMEEIAIAEDGMEEIAIDPPAIAIAEDRMEEIAIGPPADEESIIDKTIASYSLQQANVEIETSPISTTCTTSTNSSFSRPLAVVLVTNYVDASYILLPYGMILLTKYSLLLRIPPTECLMLLLLIDLVFCRICTIGTIPGSYCHRYWVRTSMCNFRICIANFLITSGTDSGSCLDIDGVVGVKDRPDVTCFDLHALSWIFCQCVCSGVGGRTPNPFHSNR